MARKKTEVREWICKRLEQADGDLLKSLLQGVIQELMSAEADAMCGADYGKRSDGRVNCRNGYRERPWDSRVGSMVLKLPKLRQGSYFPAWLLEPRKRSEKALLNVVCESYVLGVSTRKVERLVQALGMEGMSKSQVSRLAGELDALVDSFRNAPLERGPYPYVWLDAVHMRSREAGRVVNVALVLATGLNREGRREILGVDVITCEDESGWGSFLRSLKERGARGVQLVISDAHSGLKKAIASVFPGASWQRCRVHFLKNLLCRIPRRDQERVADMVRSIFAQPSAATARLQLRSVAGQLEKDCPDAAEMLLEAEDEILAYTAFPKEHWKKIWSNNPQERLNREIRRRTNVVGIFPNRKAILRLVGAMLIEQNEEWMAQSRCYMSRESIDALIREQVPKPSETHQPDMAKAA